MTHTTHYFTFGQVHWSSFDLPRGGRLADYWVAVVAETDHRGIFMERFTSLYCPTPRQFAMEYTDANFKPEYYERGELVRFDAAGLTVQEARP